MGLLTVIGYVVALVASYLLNGWALTILWGWFIRPTFHLPTLNLAPAIGLSIVIGFLTRRYDSSEQKKQTTSQKWVEPLAYAMASPLLSLGIGWIVHLFMGIAP